MSNIQQEGPPAYKDVQVVFPDKHFHSTGDECYAVPVYVFNDESGKIERNGWFQPIQFLRGHRDKDQRQEGILTEGLLGLLIERQKRLSGEVPDPDSQLVIDHLVQAMALLQRRTISRTVGGSLNTGKPT